MSAIQSNFRCVNLYRAVVPSPFSIRIASLLVLIGVAPSVLPSSQVVAAEPTASPVYNVGVAKQDITPDYPVRLNGFASRKTESDGVSQTLWARALAIGADDEESIVLITLDSLGVRSTLIDEVHRRLAKDIPIPRESLVLTFTHTHSAPKVNGASDNIFAEPIPAEHQTHLDQYTEELIVDLVEVIRAALADRQPATLQWATGEVGFAINRRTVGGPVDHSLPCLIVRATDAAQTIRAIYTSYACHCVTLSQNYLSGDWAGYAVDSIERLFPGAIAMVSIGCGSDQNPDSGVTGDNIEMAQQQGMQIGDEVARVVNEGIMKPLSAAVSTSNGHLQLPFHSIPTRQEYEAMQAEGGPAGYNATTQLAKMNRGDSIPQSLPYPIQVVHFGDELCMVFLAGEVCVDYAIRLKSELDQDRLWVHGYSHDFGAYIPSDRLWNEGGYGAGAEVPYFALPNKLAQGVEQKIVDEVHRLVPASFQVVSDQSPANSEATEPPLSRTNGIPPASPEEALQKFQTYADLKVQLVASEPQIADPVAIDFGPDGAVWVVQMSDYGRGIEEEFSPTGEVRVLKDIDGDGFYETSNVFIDSLRYPTDVKVWRDGALICDAPNILFAKDEDGDGRAETTEILFSGFETHNGQARVNSLRWGLDNWLYGSGGLFGGSISNQRGEIVDVSGRDFRIRPDQGLIEPVTGRSQQGRDRDDFGNWFGCDNSTLIRHYPVVDHYVQRNPFVVPPATSVSVPAGENAGKLFPASDLVLFRLSGAPGRATAACGIGMYRDNLLGTFYNNNSFTCEPVNQLVYRQILDREGATFRGRRAADEQDSEFLTSTDRWFRPVQARTGPDGGLWIVDMYRYVIEHPKWIPDETLAELDVFAGQGMGRIYRVVPAMQAPRRRIELSQLSNQELAKAIDSDNGIVRDLVHQMLLWRDAKDASDELLHIAQKSGNPATRIQALAALDGLHQLSSDALIHAFSDSDANVRRHAVRMSEPFLLEADVAAAVLKLAKDNSFAVRLQVANSLALLPSADATSPLVKLATESADPYLQSAALSSLTAGNLGPVVEQILGDDDSRSLVGSRVVATTAGMGDGAAIESALKRILGSSGEWQWWQFESFAQLLDGLDRRAGIGQLEIVQPSIQPDAIDHPSAPVQIDVSRRHQQAAQSIFDAARKRMRDPAVTDREAEIALTLLGRKFGLVTQALIGDDDLQSGSQSSQDLTIEIAKLIDLQFSTHRQIAATHAIGRRGGADIGATLLSRIASATPEVRTAIVQTLLSHTDADAAVLVGLESGLLHSSDFPTEDRQRFIERQSNDARANAAKWLGGETGSDRERLVAEWQDVSNLPADPEPGKVLFDKHCSVCHKFNGVGYEVGPDLSALTSLSTDFLLRAILNPNRDVDARYQSYTALMDDGRVFSGQIASETGSSVTLLVQEAKQHILLRNQLEELHASGKSAMPEGLEQSISKQEMAHVLAYVQGADSEVHQLARKLLDDSLPSEQREKLLADQQHDASQMITALTFDLPADDAEQYRRIPWIWRVAIAAGKRNETDELLGILDVSLPQLNQPLTDWQAVVLGGGLINGISQAGDWPLDRVLRMISGNSLLVTRWNQAIRQASEMSENVEVRPGTRYDALRMIAIAPWADHGEQLASYLTNANAELQMGAVSGLSDMPAAEAGQAIITALPNLNGHNRDLGLDALLRTAPRAQRLLDAIEAGDISQDWLSDVHVQQLLDHDSPAVQQRAAMVLTKQE